MSETETMDPEMVRLRRVVTLARSQRDQAWKSLQETDDRIDSLREEAAAARAEVAALRSAVERIERLAKNAVVEAHTHMWPVIERDWREVLAIIERIPAAPVPSGEAESGACPRCGARCSEPTQTSTGGVCDHEPPVSSGGQADGEGEVTRALMKAMGCKRVPSVGALAVPFYDFCERHTRSLGYGDWDVHRRECPEARRLAGVALAARPALSREAIAVIHRVLADARCASADPGLARAWGRERKIALDVLVGESR